MFGLSPVLADFDLGEYVGIGLNTNQIGYLAGALFLGLFGLSALRHAKGASGVFPVVWIAVAVGLFAGALLLSARGFPDELPEWLRPWTEPNRLTRAAAVAILLGSATIFLSAHFARDGTAKLVSRFAGLALAGLALWLAAGWFADQVPQEAREWTGQITVMQAVVILGLVFLAAAFWMRQKSGPPHARWLNRTLAPPAIAIGAILGVRWFGTRIWPELDTAEVQFVAVVVGAVATGTCLLIAGGAFLLRPRPTTVKRPKRLLPVAIPAELPPPAPARPLPVALLLDEHGRPAVPSQRPAGRHQAGPAGA
jgi:hypothetical protein